MLFTLESLTGGRLMTHDWRRGRAPGYEGWRPAIRQHREPHANTGYKVGSKAPLQHHMSARACT